MHLAREGVTTTSFIKDLPYTVVNRPKKSYLNWLFWQRELLQIKLRRKMSRKTFTLFSSLFVGNKQSVKRVLAPYKKHFKQWGVIHYLARSGLHLIIFIMIWNFLFNFISCNFFIKHVLICVISIVYLIFSWSSLSFLRAFYVYFFYKSALFLNMSLHPLHAISTVCIILLLYNPLHLFFLDFQLSFFLSFCLLWISHINQQRKCYTYKSIAALNKKTLK